MAQQPTYILSPNFHFKPGTGPIGLGNIISHPLRPHRALTTVDATTLEKVYPRIERFTDHERSIERGDSRDVSMSLWAEFLQTVSGKLSGGRGSDVRSNYRMDQLETEYFVTDPPLEEIQARLKSPRVQAVTKAGRIPGLRNPVYMVTGLMIAKGFTAIMENNKRHNGEIEVGGNIPSPGFQVGAGANLAKSTSTEESDTWRAGEDILFAYQLLKIEVKGWKGNRVKYDELRHKAAYLSKDDEDETDEDDDAVEEIIIGSADPGTLSSDHDQGSMTVTEIGEGDSRVNCISSIVGSDP
ncbi:hypothetical protein AtubIFM56815_008499 [Aspergillus tubingensis]|uniref:Uncharacterized protein n=2 Tax=Aspergillus subgen. Circumdati TaxID=2720871 RepID=A0A8H3SK11_ASPTU|nr:aldehyde dehydrogenase, conserved site [Aspergillus tubingensis]GAQ42971.1 similar to An14g01520 [Aspergillus niger]GFN10931.1 aldehyde dehydrogenase, conserved site [Aspergillus tubingensis]GLA65328.1 hypothetical protein AtubIFM54640_007078 [Aspergillus tubingensis]GLA84288.1 hypothetical protein AtubIFM56815_008499 [Aspergillus tubingensis]GLA98016.1 hypothetical protein AtubIFM57143_005949 [Aspergillus tubingensis]